jgi:DNA-binding IclR family transcriptional regulator
VLADQNVHRDKDMPPSYMVPMVMQTFKILEAFPESGLQISLREISILTEVNKTSVFRILFSLERLGYVVKDAKTGKYQLAFKITGLARKAAAGFKLSLVAKPYLEDLRDRFEETVNLAAIQDGKIFYQDILESPHSFRMVATVGSLIPLHSTAIGKAIAAFQPAEQLRTMMKGYKFRSLTLNTIRSRRKFLMGLSNVRRQGYSLDNEESEVGASCVGAPILNSSEHALGAISISGPTLRIRSKRPMIIEALVDAASSISETLKMSDSWQQKLVK